MPPKRISRSAPSSGTKYRSTPAAPQQKTFSARRKSVKTYGRPKSGRKLKQETLTQMNFTSALMDHAVDPDDDNDDDKDNDVDDYNDMNGDDGDDSDDSDDDVIEMKEAVDVKTYERSDKGKGAKKRTSDIRDTDDDRSDSDEMLRESKKRKTLSGSRSISPKQAEDSEMASTIAKYTTQTMSCRGDMYIENSSDEDLDELSCVPETPKKHPGLRNEQMQGTAPTIPGVVKPMTPAPQLRGMTVPSSQSPGTSLLRRYSTPQSPLADKSITIASSVTPRTGVTSNKSHPIVHDSYATRSSIGASSPVSHRSSPSDKENITPGRTKPKSPKPQTKSAGRAVLLEIPDSDDETSESDGTHACPSPSIRQTRRPFPPVRVRELGTVSLAPLDTPSEGARGSVVSSGNPIGSASEAQDNAMNEDDEGEETPKLQKRQDMTIPAPLSDSAEASNNNGLSSSVPNSPRDFESQRLPLKSIHALGAQTPTSDIIVSLHPHQVAKIVNRSKTHDFRAWKIPEHVSRVWLYTTRPECQLKYMCLYGEPKVPGELNDEQGIGNAEFNQGKLVEKFAYEILQVYELNNPVPLAKMQRKGWISRAPPKFAFIPQTVVGEITANLRCALFEDGNQSEASSRQGITESKEGRPHLSSEAGYSPQNQPGASEEVIPASPTPRQKVGVTGHAMAGKRPARSGPRSRAINVTSARRSQRLLSSPVRPSQATTVSQVSSSSHPVTPQRPIAVSVPNSSEFGSSPPTGNVKRRLFSSPQFPRRSQMLPDSLLNTNIQEPPDIIWDSADDSPVRETFNDVITTGRLDQGNY